GHMISASKSERSFNRMSGILVNLSCQGHKMFDDRPNASAGENFKRPTEINKPASSNEKKSPSVGNGPKPSRTGFFPTREPAIAIGGMIIMNRPISMVRAPVTLNHSVFPLIPAKAEPLFPAWLL